MVNNTTILAGFLFPAPASTSGGSRGLDEKIAHCAGKLQVRFGLLGLGGSGLLQAAGSLRGIAGG
jgi:hypothetical protein